MWNQNIAPLFTYLVSKVGSLSYSLIVLLGIRTPGFRGFSFFSFFFCSRGLEAVTFGFLGDGVPLFLPFLGDVFLGVDWLLLLVLLAGGSSSSFSSSFSSTTSSSSSVQMNKNRFWRKHTKTGEGKKTVFWLFLTNVKKNQSFSIMIKTLLGG